MTLAVQLCKALLTDAQVTGRDRKGYKSDVVGRPDISRNTLTTSIIMTVNAITSKGQFDELVRPLLPPIPDLDTIR